MPRDRDGEFEPQLVKKNQTTLTGDIEEKIISMYAKAVTSRIYFSMVASDFSSFTRYFLNF